MERWYCLRGASERIRNGLELCQDRECIGARLMATPPRVKLLVVNGCSYTRGAELERPEVESWPARLGAALNLPVINLASDGGSNRRVVRTTIQEVGRLTGEGSYAPEEILVIVMWTALTRFECFQPNAEDRGKRCEIEDELLWWRIGPWKVSEGDRRSSVYMKHLWNEEGAYLNFLIDWIGLQSFLSSCGVLGRYTFAWRVLPKARPIRARKYEVLLKEDHILGGGGLSSGKSFRKMVEELRQFGVRGHPLSPAHQAYVDKFLLQELLRDPRLSFATASHPSGPPEERP